MQYSKYRFSKTYEYSFNRFGDNFYVNVFSKVDSNDMKIIKNIQLIRQYNLCTNFKKHLIEFILIIYSCYTQL